MSQTENNSAPEETGAKDQGGRPPFEWTQERIDLVLKLSEIQCTKTEIAYVLGISYDTLKRHAGDWMEAGRANGRVKLRRAQWRNAIDENNTTMQIWLGKQILGQTDNPVNEQDSIILPWEE